MNGSSRLRQKGGPQDVVQGSRSSGFGKSAGMGGTKQTQGYRQGLKSRGSSAAIDGDVVPEDGIGGGSHLLSLAGREGGQESLEFVGQEAGRGWRARGCSQSSKCWRILRMTPHSSMKAMICIRCPQRGHVKGSTS